MKLSSLSFADLNAILSGKRFLTLREIKALARAAIEREANHRAQGIDESNGTVRMVAPGEIEELEEEIENAKEGQLETSEENERLTKENEELKTKVAELTDEQTGISLAA